ncbi:MAG: alcohol dehydrogenase [Myxococcales bacterium]|nr:alcohol dehydrogenase [Myxococcales bacterium]
MSFRGILLTKNDDVFRAEVTELDEGKLPAGDVTVRIAYSTLNYKDGLAITNRAPVVRSWPMVAGIDAVGTVETSDAPSVRSGEAVVLNGFGVGETHWGGLAERARLKSEWLVKLPEAISPRRAMAIGTAGYTAMLCVMALEDGGVRPGEGEILVTGATGGVGSVAVTLLGKLGYDVAASTGKASEGDWLKRLGARSIVDRATLSAAGKPLQKERWAGVVDSVGSHTLANACAQTRYGGVVAACGLAQGMDFPATVAPFILRGVRLQGVDSVMAPRALRERAWSRLAADLDLEKLDALSREVSLGDAIGAAAELMAGRVRGRIVVDVNR